LFADKETLVFDAGKLFVLDGLLARLKAEGHRVLIYSQMTRFQTAFKFSSVAPPFKTYYDSFPVVVKIF
jgi:hypothetical protein